MTTKQYLDIAGVVQLWEAIKNYIDNNGSSGEDETEMGMRIFEVEYDVSNGRYYWMEGSYSDIQTALEDGYIPCLRIYSDYAPFRGIYYFVKHQAYNNELWQDDDPFNDNSLNDEYDEKTKYTFISTPKFSASDGIYYTIIDVLEDRFSENIIPNDFSVYVTADNNGIRFSDDEFSYENIDLRAYHHNYDNDKYLSLQLDIESENINLPSQKLKLDGIENVFDPEDENNDSYCATFTGQAMDPDSPQIYFINVKWTQNYAPNNEGETEKTDTLTFKISKTSDIEYVTL